MCDLIWLENTLRSWQRLSHSQLDSSTGRELGWRCEHPAPNVRVNERETWNIKKKDWLQQLSVRKSSVGFLSEWRWKICSETALMDQGVYKSMKSSISQLRLGLGMGAAIAPLWWHTAWQTCYRSCCVVYLAITYIYNCKSDLLSEQKMHTSQGFYLLILIVAHNTICFLFSDMAIQASNISD